MISVIVPLYNTAEPLLRKCLDSVLGQIFDDWELVIVDDGSTNGAGAVADVYAAKDSRIRVHHCKNGGLSVARNTGIDISTGSHIVFLDSDDMLAPYALQRFASVSSDTGASIVIAGYNEGYRPVFDESPNDCSASVCDYIDIIQRALYQEDIAASACGKLYSRSLFDNVRFKEGILYEDLEFFYRVCEHVDGIAVIPDKLMFYRMTPGSILHVWSERRFDILDIVDSIEAYMAKSYPQLLKAARNRKLSANFNMFFLAVRHGNKSVAARCWNVIRAYRKEAILDRRVRFKNKAASVISYLGRPVFSMLNVFGGS